MSETRLQQLLAGHSTSARKIFEYIPIREAWTIGEIYGALKRDQSVTIAHKSVTLCIGELKDQGLVREVKRGFFQRAPVKAEPKNPPGPDPRHASRKDSAYYAVTLRQPIKSQGELPVAKDVVVTKKEKATPAIDLLAGLSIEMVELSNEFGKRMGALAARIEEVALQVETEREKDAESLKKYKELQTLLAAIHSPAA